MYRGKQLETAAGPSVKDKATAKRRPNHPAGRPTDDEFLAHYFRRIDPAVAASFTKEQRHAMRTMFGDRGAARHPVDVRCTFPLGWRRFYLVLLLGRDRRRTIRPRNGLPGDMGDWLAYMVLSLGLLAALFMLLSLIKI